MSKTHQPSVTGRRTSHTLGEYCTASAVSIFLGLPDPWVQEAPPDWPGFCDAGPGHTSRPSVCNSAYKHTAACQEKVFLAMGHPGAGTAWNGTPCPPNWVVGGMCHLRSLLSLLIRASADLHPWGVLCRGSECLGGCFRGTDAFQRNDFCSGHLNPNQLWPLCLCLLGMGEYFLQTPTGLSDSYLANRFLTLESSRVIGGCKRWSGVE